MAQPARNVPQNKEALLSVYQKRLKDDIRAMIDNYMEIVKLARVETDESQINRSTAAEQDQYEMEVRASNIVRAAESLMKLVSDVRQFLILNDFPSVNESIRQKVDYNKQVIADVDTSLLTLRDDMSAHLYELEEEYYSSPYK